MYWPASDVLGDLRLVSSPPRAASRSRIAFQGGRRFVHSSSVLLAADCLASGLLAQGDEIVCLEAARFRRPLAHDLQLTAVGASPPTPESSDAAISACFRTRNGHALYVQGVPADARIRRHHRQPRVVSRMIASLEHLSAPPGLYRTRIAPGRAFRPAPDPVLDRFAVFEFVLEATRAPIRACFGDLGRDRLVVAALDELAFVPWSAVNSGGIVEYTLSEGAFSGGTPFVRCSFAFGGGPRTATLTVARIPAARLVGVVPARDPGPEPTAGEVG